MGALIGSTTRRGLLVGLMTTAALIGGCAPLPAAPAQPQPTQVGTAKPGTQDAAASGQMVRMGFNKTWTTPFLLIAKNQGYFSKNNVQVEWVEFASPPQAIEALAAGAVDVIAAPVPNFVTAYEKGVDAKVVMNLAGWSDPTSTYFVRADSDIKTVTDLKGKKIGVNNYGGNFDLYLRQILVKSGIDPKKDVQILEVPIPAIFQSLQAKQIDVGAVPPLFVPTAEEKFPGQLRQLFSYRDVPEVKDRPQFNQLILAMRSSMLNNNRPVAKQFLKAISDAQSWGYANRQAAATAWSQEAGSPGLATLKDPFGPDLKGRIDVPAFQLDVRLMNEFGYSRSQPAVSAVIDESLLDELGIQKN